VLGIPDDATQIALLPVAYTTTTDFRPADLRSRRSPPTTVGWIG
jgi:hypothetical protein